MYKPMMACGHSANAVDGGGKPCCVICTGINGGAGVIVDTPDLTCRIAKCGCGNSRPSSTELAFFEYMGPGSNDSLTICKKCGYSVVAHKPINNNPYKGAPFENCTFDPHGPYDHDRYYCGHAGLD